MFKRMLGHQQLRLNGIVLLLQCAANCKGAVTEYVTEFICKLQNNRPDLAGPSIKPLQ